MRLKKTRPVGDILVVDDMAVNLEVLTPMLKERGHRVRPVPDGRMAIEAARLQPPDLILLDINMPGMDGYQVCATLKADPRLAPIPVIFISANNEVFDKVTAFAVGGVDYVTKPFQLEEVEARVETHLELVRQRREIEGNYRKLAELETLRDSLVHMLVHDLRSPLMAIMGNLDSLRLESGSLSADQKSDLEEAYKASNRMAQMVTGVLDVNKLESGKMTVHPASCDVLALGREVVAGLGSLAEGRALSFLPKGELIAWLDRGLIYRVLQNLVSNALRFAPKNGGKVELRIEPRGGETRVEVIDNGPGIPAEHQERIFEKFGQVEAGAGDRSFSTGIGLTFCKMAVEAHGGRIGVVSEGGKGSTFWFTLPGKPPEG